MIYPELCKKSLKIPKKVIRNRRLKESDNTMAKRKRTKGPILIKNSFTCSGLKYFVDRIRAFSNIRANAIMHSPISLCKCRARYIDIGYICKNEN
jgi:hypothetical protein